MSDDLAIRNAGDTEQGLQAQAPTSSKNLRRDDDESDEEFLARLLKIKQAETAAAALSASKLPVLEAIAKKLAEYEVAILRRAASSTVSSDNVEADRLKVELFAMISHALEIKQ